MRRLARSDVDARKIGIIAVVAAVVVAVARPVLHAADTALEVALITAAAAAGVAATAVAAVFVIRAHRHQSHTLQALPMARARAARQPAPAIPAPQRLAFGAPSPSAAEELGPEDLDEAEGDLIRRAIRADPH